MLNRRRILIVEDEYMLAQDLQRELESAGAQVVGPEPSVARALARIAVEPRIDAAILDVNLAGTEVYAVADVLADKQVPFLFCTGYEDDIVKTRFPDAIICDKPLDPRRLFEALAGMVDANKI